MHCECSETVGACECVQRSRREECCPPSPGKTRRGREQWVEHQPLFAFMSYLYMVWVILPLWL
jgi:hypothetical protein